ncbi:MAG: class I SAM-dependent methyltransferase [bacterium]
MIQSKNSLAQHPFAIWKSPEVTDLLVDFFGANFIKAELSKDLAKSLIIKVWENKGTIDAEVLRKEGDVILNEVSKVAKKPSEEKETLDMVDFNGVKTFLDIGANKLATINYYMRKQPEVARFIGVDIVPKRGQFSNLKKGFYYQVDPEAKSFPINNESIDLVNIQFVFHHFPDLESIKRSLAIYKNIVKPNGRLVLWEESFTDNFDLSLVKSNNENLGIKTDQELTERFYQLSEEKRWEFIIANDWLINVNNAHMPWTGQYYAWREWVELLREFGFALEREYNLGLRINGRLKQGVHMMGVFRKE